VKEIVPQRERFRPSAIRATGLSPELEETRTPVRSTVVRRDAPLSHEPVTLALSSLQKKMLHRAGTSTARG